MSGAQNHSFSFCCLPFADEAETIRPLVDVRVGDIQRLHVIDEPRQLGVINGIRAHAEADLVHLRELLNVRVQVRLEIFRVLDVAILRVVRPRLGHFRAELHLLEFLQVRLLAFLN